MLQIRYTLGLWRHFSTWKKKPSKFIWSSIHDCMNDLNNSTSSSKNENKSSARKKTNRKTLSNKFYCCKIYWLVSSIWQNCRKIVKASLYQKDWFHRLRAILIFRSRIWTIHKSYDMQNFNVNKQNKEKLKDFWFYKTWW